MFLISLYRFYRLIMHFAAPVVFYARLAWNKVWPEQTPMRRLQMQKGQGLVEYALVLVLVAVVVIAILTMLGPRVGLIFFNVNCTLDGGTVVEVIPGYSNEHGCYSDPTGDLSPFNSNSNWKSGYNIETGEVYIVP